MSCVDIYNQVRKKKTSSVQYMILGWRFLQWSDIWNVRIRILSLWCFLKGCRCCYLLIALPFGLEWSFTCCSLKKYHSCFPLFISPFSFNSIVKKEKKRWNSKIFIPCFNILNERVFYSCCILILGEKLSCILVFSPVWEHIETGSTFVPDGKKNLAHVNDLLIKLSNFNCDATLPSMLYVR